MSREYGAQTSLAGLFGGQPNPGQISLTTQAGVFFFNPSFNAAELQQVPTFGGNTFFPNTAQFDTRTIGPFGRAPTIATFTATTRIVRNVVGENAGDIPANTIGVRLWVCATPDLVNGVWAQLDLVAGLSNPQRIYVQNSLQSLNFEPSAPGAANDGNGEFFGNALVSNDVFEATLPATIGGAVRLWKLSYGYTRNSTDVMKGEIYTASERPFELVELSVDPYAAMDQPANEIQIAGLSFENRERMFVFPFGTVTSSNQVGFAVNPQAVTEDTNLGDRRVIIETRYGVNASPAKRLNVNLSRVSTAVISELTQMPVTVGRPIAGLAYLPATIALDDRLLRTVQYEGTEYEGRPDISSKSRHGVTNGVSWHEQAIVAHGTLNGVQDRRNHLLITNNFVDADRLPQARLQGFGGFNPANIFEATSPEFKFLTLSPEIDGRPLPPRQYYGKRVLPTFEFNASQGHYISSSMVECFAITRRREQVYEEGEFQNQLLESREAALEAGMTEDMYDFFKLSDNNNNNFVPRQLRIYSTDAREPSTNRSGRGTHFGNRGTTIDLQIHYSVKYQVFRWGAFVGDRTRHAYFRELESITLTHSECDVIADGGISGDAHYDVQLIGPPPPPP